MATFFKILLREKNGKIESIERRDDESLIFFQHKTGTTKWEERVK